jgi:hypothetical protein
VVNVIAVRSKKRVENVVAKLQVENVGCTALMLGNCDRLRSGQGSWVYRPASKLSDVSNLRTPADLSAEYARRRIEASDQKVKFRAALFKPSDIL